MYLFCLFSIVCEAPISVKHAFDDKLMMRLHAWSPDVNPDVNKIGTYKRNLQSLLYIYIDGDLYQGNS